METLEADTKGLVVMSPSELRLHLRSDASGNMAAFLNTATGMISEHEADALSRLIRESCERVDE